MRKFGIIPLWGWLLGVLVLACLFVISDVKLSSSCKI